VVLPPPPTNDTTSPRPIRNAFAKVSMSRL
jgi:hypothetical protein